MAQFRSLVHSYINGTAGAAAIWAVFTAPVLVGVAAISVDASRLYNMDNDLQNAADAFARAAATELDQRSDSLTRATSAVNNLVSNDQKFSKDGVSAVEVNTIRFLKSIPDHDYEDIGTAHETTVPSEAKFVEVTVKPETVSTIFPSSMVSGLIDITLDAKAVATTSQSVCRVAPIFICNPVEGSGTSIYTALEDPAFQRRHIRFVPGSGGNNTQYGPGNYGFLDPYGNNSGTDVIRDSIAVDKPDACLSKAAGVHLRPGAISSINQGFNTRFDIYSGSFNSKKNDPAYAPAANVTKGYSYNGNNACNASPDSNALGLPRDSCFDDDSCTSADGRMGAGDWDFVEYMKINHNSAAQVTIADVTYSLDYTNHVSTPAAPPSRYNLYRWEIESGSIPGAISYGTSSTPEEGTPQCHASGASSAVDDRRIVHAAVLNCNWLDAQGYSMNGNSGPLPVETFVKVFLTEPMGNGNDDAMYGEVVGAVIQGVDTPARDSVVLSR